jgi:hydroxypyruvate reductase 1
VGSKCDGVIGQLTEKWDADTFGALRSAGGTAYSNYAVGYDNVNVADATAAGVAVGNTPGARCGVVAPRARVSVQARCCQHRPPDALPLRAGVLTETTAETAAALTLAAARRIAEARRKRPQPLQRCHCRAAPPWQLSRAPPAPPPRAQADVFMRAGQYKGWLPTLFVGQLLQGQTVGIVGAGRIGAAYARMVRHCPFSCVFHTVSSLAQGARASASARGCRVITAPILTLMLSFALAAVDQMVEGHKMNLLYYDPYRNAGLEDYVTSYGAFLKARGEAPVTVRRCETVAELLAAADVVSLHTVLDAKTRHLIDAKALKTMKKSSVLVNCARGPVVDEAALVAHLKANPEFRVGLDVFEREPEMAPGLAECRNAVIVPHIASASVWTRGGMATLAAANVAARLGGLPVWGKPNDVTPFLEGAVAAIPKASPSIVNADALKLPKMA